MVQKLQQMKKKHINILLIFVVSTLLISCSSYKQQCNKKIDKEIARHKKEVAKINSICPEALFIDSVKVDVLVPVPKLEIHTEFKIVIDSSKIDSLVNVIDKLSSQKQKVEFIKNFIRDNYHIDTTNQNSEYSVHTRIINGIFTQDILIYQKDIIVPLKVPIIENKKLELTLQEKIYEFLKSSWLLIIIVLCIVFLYYMIHKSKI